MGWIRTTSVLLALILTCVADASAQTSARALHAGDSFSDCDGHDWCPLMVALPDGQFMMGSSDGVAIRTSCRCMRSRSSHLRFRCTKSHFVNGNIASRRAPAPRDQLRVGLTTVGP